MRYVGKKGGTIHDYLIGSFFEAKEEHHHRHHHLQLRNQLRARIMSAEGFEHLVTCHAVRRPYLSLDLGNCSANTVLQKME